MNNSQYRQFRADIMKYKNLVNQGRIKRISEQVQEGTKTRNQGLVEAYNQANIEYRAQMTGYYPKMIMKVLKLLVSQRVITGKQVTALTGDRAMRRFVRQVAGEGPRRPPCVKIQNVRGCSNTHKAIQGFGRSARRAATTPFRAVTGSLRGVFK